jgi:SAM-dependent methyltransferase
VAQRVAVARPRTRDLSAGAPLRETDRAAVARYLASFDWPGRTAEIEENIIRGGLPLWLEILRFVPQAPPGGRLLELGSPPFHITLLLAKLRTYEIVTTAGLLDDRRRRLTMEMTSAASGDRRVFDCACFDLERERFPYPDDSFDVVLFCEVIEHLAENPVFTLSEIHRVLRPGGRVVLSTPNAARSGNVLRIWFGGNVYDQYHLGSPLRGSRHSREYTLRELEALIGGCGFRSDAAVGRNLGQTQYTRRTRPFEPLFRFVTRFAFGNHADYLFVSASKVGRFRWSFPPEVFDQGHLHGYLDVRAADVVFGENDVPHTTGGWGPLRDGARAVPEGGGAVHLVASETSGGCAVDVAPASRGRIAATAFRADAPAALGTAAADVGAGNPSRVVVRFEAPVEPGAGARLELAASGDVLVRRVALVA